MFNNLNRWWPAIALCVICLLAGIGCGSSAPAVEVPPLLPVKGTVLIDGTPTPGVSVTLLPTGKTKGQVAYAVSDDAGAFEILYAPDTPGCPEGAYAVLCSKLVTPEGQPVPEGTNAADVMAKDLLPVKYRDAGSPFQTVEVAAPGIEDLKLELQTK